MLVKWAPDGYITVIQFISPFQAPPAYEEPPSYSAPQRKEDPALVSIDPFILIVK